ncbi:MAG: hypothetical protein QXR30_02130 [Candidatus Woesearchaeota archaeon]
MNKTLNIPYFKVILIFLVYLLFSFFSSFAENSCKKNEKIEICIQECSLNSFCKLLIFFEGKTLYIFPGNSDYILITDSPVKFLKFYSVMFTNSPATLEIIPLKKEFNFNNLVLDNVFYKNFTLVVPDEIIEMNKEETKNETSSVEKRNNFLDKITEFNRFYLIFVGVFFVVLIAYEIVYQKKNQSYGPEIDRLIKQIEEEKKMKQQNQQLNDDVNIKNNFANTFENPNLSKVNPPLELSLGVNELEKILNDEKNRNNNQQGNLLNKRNIDISVLRKTILISKMKGIPKESLYNHLKSKYNDSKILKEVIDEIYK